MITVSRVYPQLSDPDTHQRWEELRPLRGDVRRLRAASSFEHPAMTASNGGQLVTTRELEGLREVVRKEVDAWTRDLAPRNDLVAFDRALGRVLHRELDITAAEAGRPEVWNFLTVMVFPELVSVRFGADPNRARVFGGPRNVLRRTWMREDVLGELLHEGAPPLGEDELVGLLERSALARCRPLVRALARRILDHEAKGRMEFARRLCKRAAHHSGVLMFDLMPEVDLGAFVDSLDV